MVNTSKNCLDNINYLVQYSIKIVKTWYKMFKYFRFPIITVVCLSCSLTTIVSNNVVKLEKKNPLESNKNYKKNKWRFGPWQSENKLDFNVDFGSERSKQIVHQTLFEVFSLKNEFKKNSYLDIITKKTQKDLWKKINKNKEIQVYLTILSDLSIFKNTDLFNRLVSYEPQMPYNSIFISSKDLADLNYYLRDLNRINVKPHFWNLKDVEKYKFLMKLVLSDNNFLVRMGTLLRKVYLGHIYADELGELLVGSFEKDQSKSIPVKKISNFKSHLSYNHQKKRIEGVLDYIIVGGQGAGSIVAYELASRGHKVLILDSNNLTDKKHHSTLGKIQNIDFTKIYNDNNYNITFFKNRLFSNQSLIGDNIIDLPTKYNIRSKINFWRQKNFFSNSTWNSTSVIDANNYILKVLNNENFSLFSSNEANNYFEESVASLGETPITVGLNLKKDKITGKMFTNHPLYSLLQKKMENYKNPVSYLPNALVTKILSRDVILGKSAYGVEFKVTKFKRLDGSFKDPIRLNLPEGEIVSVKAKKIILAGGTIGSYLLLKSSGVINKNVGKWLSINPMIPILAKFSSPLNDPGPVGTSINKSRISYYEYNKNVSIEDIDKSKKDYFGEYYSLPFKVNKKLVALLSNGNPSEVLSQVKYYQNYLGIAVVFVDKAKKENYISVDKSGKLNVNYLLTAQDKKLFIKSITKVMKSLLDAGAHSVTLPSLELIFYENGLWNVFSRKEDIDIIEKKIKFLPHLTQLFSQQINGGNAMGMKKNYSIINEKHEVWGMKNTFIVDASIFPGNLTIFPKQTLYVFAKLFVDSMLEENY